MEIENYNPDFNYRGELQELLIKSKSFLDVSIDKFSYESSGPPFRSILIIKDMIGKFRKWVANYHQSRLINSSQNPKSKFIRIEDSFISIYSELFPKKNLAERFSSFRLLCLIKEYLSFLAKSNSLEVTIQNEFDHKGHLINYLMTKSQDLPECIFFNETNEMNTFRTILKIPNNYSPKPWIEIIANFEQINDSLYDEKFDLGLVFVEGKGYASHLCFQSQWHPKKIKADQDASYIAFQLLSLIDRYLVEDFDSSSLSSSSFSPSSSPLNNTSSSPYDIEPEFLNAKKTNFKGNLLEFLRTLPINSLDVDFQFETIDQRGGGGGGGGGGPQFISSIRLIDLGSGLYDKLSEIENQVERERERVRGGGRRVVQKELWFDFVSLSPSPQGVQRELSERTMKNGNTTRIRGERESEGKLSAPSASSSFFHSNNKSILISSLPFPTKKLSEQHVSFRVLRLLQEMNVSAFSSSSSPSSSSPSIIGSSENHKGRLLSLIAQDLKFNMEVKYKFSQSPCTTATTLNMTTVFQSHLEVTESLGMFEFISSLKSLSSPSLPLHSATIPFHSFLLQHTQLPNEPSPPPASTSKSSLICTFVIISDPFPRKIEAEQHSSQLLLSWIDEWRQRESLEPEQETISSPASTSRSPLHSLSVSHSVSRIDPQADLIDPNDERSLLHSLKIEDIYIPYESSPPYPYQMEGFAHTLRHNTIIVLPTGRGKTLIATLTLARYRKLNPHLFSVLIVERIPLVEQHSRSIEEQTSLRVCRLHGKLNTPQTRAQIFSRNQVDVIVATGGSLLELIKKYNFPLHETGVLIFDECHHVTGNHCYKEIIKQLPSNPRLVPRLVGLTATICSADTSKSAMSQIRKMQSDLHKAVIFKPLKSVDEIYDVTWDIISYTPFQNWVFQFLSKEINDSISSLKLNLDVGLLEQDDYPKPFQWDVKPRWSEWMKVANKCLELGLKISEASHLSDLIGQLEMNEVLGPKYVNEYRRSKEYDPIPYPDNIISPPPLPTPTTVSIANTWEEEDDISSLLRCLETHLSRIHDLSTSRVLVFVSTKVIANWIETRLNDSFPNFNCQKVVGHTGKKKAERMPLRKQSENLQKFNVGETKLLVSTSVVEEGLDVQACNYVFRLGGHGSMIQTVQSRGRARQENGKMIIISSDQDADREQKIAQQEKDLDEATEICASGVDLIAEGNSWI